MGDLIFGLLYIVAIMSTILLTLGIAYIVISYISKRELDKYLDCVQAKIEREKAYYDNNLGKR